MAQGYESSSSHGDPEHLVDERPQMTYRDRPFNKTPKRADNNLRTLTAQEEREVKMSGLRMTAGLCCGVPIASIRRGPTTGSRRPSSPTAVQTLEKTWSVRCNSWWP
jgi:hypothetical protein